MAQRTFKWYPGIFIFLICLLLSGPARAAGQCTDIQFDHTPSDYYGSGEYFPSCSGVDEKIRCYHYHRHWVCENGDRLYWDRRLESAALAACGCSLPPDIAPASPALSEKPYKEIIHVKPEMHGK